MKTFLYISIGLTVVFIVSQAFISGSMSKIEKYKYTVLKEFDDFEVRQYEAAMFSSVKMNAKTYEETSSSGFRVLAGYIFGGNEKNEKIAMTSPVVMEMGDTTKMSFMVPSDLKENELPKPNNGRIYFEKQEPKIMAAIRFGGWANDKRIEEYKQKLSLELEKQGLKHTGKFNYLGYNPPYALIARRNEVVVELVGFEMGE
jgi:SOUL heme-binding protein